MMKALLLAVTLGGALLVGAPAGAQISIDIDVFHDRLSPYGDWVDHDDFGRVWSPYRRDWRPYSEGRWVYTDDYGWLWVEEEDWGWATEHYGRWFYDRRQGWLWLPGSEWAPAWVSWRSAPDYIGWAPLAPRGWRYDDDDDDDWDRRRWRFVRGDRFLAPNVRTVLIEPSRNVWLLERVPSKGEVRRARGRWENRAFDTRFVEQVTRKEVKRVRIRDLDRARRAEVERDSVAVFRPEVRENERWRSERDRSKQRAAEREQGKRDERGREQKKAAEAAERERAKSAREGGKAERERSERAERVERSERKRVAPSENERAKQARPHVAPREEKSTRPPKATERKRESQPPKATERKRGSQPPKTAERKRERAEPRAQPPQARKQASPEPRVARERRGDDRGPARQAPAKGKGKSGDDEKRGRGDGKRGSGS